MKLLQKEKAALGFFFGLLLLLIVFAAINQA